MSYKRVLEENEHEQVALVVVKDTVVHTSVTTFKLLDVLATIRPHVGATTNQGQVCVLVYATVPPAHTVVNTVPSGQVLVTVLDTPMLHVVVNTEAVAAPLE